MKYPSELIEALITRLDDSAPTSECTQAIRSKRQARHVLKGLTGRDFRYDVDAWFNWFDELDQDELDAELTLAMWQTIAREGVSPLRFFRRALSAAEVEAVAPSVVEMPEWVDLKSRLHQSDELWPFRWPKKQMFFLTFQTSGYIAMRGKAAIGGIFSASS